MVLKKEIMKIKEFLSIISSFSNYQDCSFYFLIQDKMIPVNNIYKDADNNVFICYDTRIMNRYKHKKSLKLKDIIKRLSKYSEDNLLFYRELTSGIDMRSDLYIYSDQCLFDVNYNSLVYKIPMPVKW